MYNSVCVIFFFFFGIILIFKINLIYYMGQKSVGPKSNWAWIKIHDN